MLAEIPLMDLYHDSTVDGEGLRSVVFVAGCPHHCPECHNPESWEVNNGKPWTVQEIFDELMSNPLTNVTFSGGEPTLYAKELIPLAKALKAEGKNIWMWSGWTFEELQTMKHQKELLKYIDVLVDGRFVIALRDITENNMYRGSLNQRVLKLENGEVVEELYPNGYIGGNEHANN